MTLANSMSILKGWGGYAAVAIARFRALAPYALIELVLPGGSVMALLLWLYRRRKNGVGCGPLPMRLLALPIGKSFALQCGRSECMRQSEVWLSARATLNGGQAQCQE